MPAHFRPGASRPRAGALRGVAADALAEGDLAAHVGRPRSAPGWVGDGATEFVELVRHNVVLPADAAPWIAVVRGELPPLGAEERRIVAAAGPEFFRGGRRPSTSPARTLNALAKILKERTGRKGAELFMPLRVALTGRTHGPELAPLLKIDAAGNGAAAPANPMLKIHNSLTGRERREFKPIGPAKCACTSAASPCTTTSTSAMRAC